MLKHNFVSEKIIITDSMLFASNLKHSLLKENKILSGLTILTFKKFVQNYLLPIFITSKRAITDRDSIKEMFQCLKDVAGTSGKHLLSPCLQHPAYRFDIFSFIEKIKLSGLQKNIYKTAFNTKKWKALMELFDAYNTRLEHLEYLDYPDQIMALISCMDSKNYNPSAISFELIIDENAIISQLEKDLINKTGSTGIKISLIKSFADLFADFLKEKQQLPEIETYAFPNSETETEYVLLKLLSTQKAFDDTIIAAANYDKTVENIQNLLTEWKAEEFLPVNYSGGISVKNTLSLGLFFKILSFFNATNLPAFFISLLTNYQFQLPETEEDSTASRQIIKKIFSEYPGYFRFNEMLKLIDTSKNRKENENLKTDFKVLEIILKQFKDIYTVFSDFGIKENEKILEIGRFFEKICKNKGAVCETAARSIIIEAINQFIDEEYMFISSEKTDVIIRYLKKYISGKYYFTENKTGAIQIMPLSEIFGKTVSHIYVTGLSSKIFPRKAIQNPLFLDTEIDRINEIAGKKILPDSVVETKRFDYEKEKLLQAAKDVLILSYVFYDGVKLVAPSDFMVENSNLNSDDINSLEDYLELIGADPDLEQIAADTAKVLPLNLYSSPELLNNAAVFSLIYKKFEKIRSILFNRQINNKLTIYDGKVIKKGDLSWFKELDKIFSASSLKNFLQCPFRFFLEKILYLESPKIPEDWDGATWLDIMTKGILYHEILEAFFNKIKDKKISINKQQEILKKTACKIFQFYKEQTLPEDKIFIHETSIILKTIESLLNNEKNINNGKNYKNRFNEASFGFGKDIKGDNILSSKPVTVNIGNGLRIKLSGKIDRIDIDAKRKTARLVDYKTGKNRLHKEPAMWLINAENIQHIVYGMVFENFIKKYNIKIIKCGYYFISANEQFALKTVDYSTVIDRFKKILTCTIKGTEDEGGFYLNPDSCKYCNCISVCIGNMNLIDQKSGKSIMECRKILAQEDLQL